MTGRIAFAVLFAIAPIACHEAPSGPRTIAIEVSDSRGYEPARLELVAGEPVRLAFHSTATSDCMRQVVSDDLTIPLTTLPIGETVTVEVTPKVPGTFSFSCGMGMVSGTVVVKAA